MNMADGEMMTDWGEAAEEWARARRLMASCDVDLAIEAFVAGAQWQARTQRIAMACIAQEALKRPPSERERHIQDQMMLLTGRIPPREQVRAILRDGVRALSRACPRRPGGEGNP